MSGLGRATGDAGLRDDARFAQLYEHHHRAIHNYCRRRVANQLVDDAVADTFLTAWRKIADLPGDDQVLPWLYKVAYRVVGHQWRSTARRRRLEDKLRSIAHRPVADADAVLVDRDERRLVLEAAGHLGTTDAEVLRLVAWEQLPIADIAEVLDIAPNAVKQRIHRAKQRLGREYRLLDAQQCSTPDAPNAPNAPKAPDAPKGGAQ